MISARLTARRGTNVNVFKTPNRDVAVSIDDLVVEPATSAIADEIAAAFAEAAKRLRAREADTGGAR